ncbi:class C sortase [Murdochiella vaginalis]|uniref:class C sortase n=1 Tax=Murdochiella vaginalis TaxID=1852373 RepID=UPI0008FDF67D|nr:class C sortase [Murdochiella vaginalis]
MLPILLFLMGLALFSYPYLSDLYYRVEQKDQVANFVKGKEDLSPEEIAERMRLAQGYNDSLLNQPTKDPYVEKNREEGRRHYAKMLEIEEKIGVIQYPAVNIELPIYAGTNEDVLQHAAGHLEGTSLPIGGNSTHAVITTHSGLPNVRLFTDLHEAKVGDKFYVHNFKEILAYQVDAIDKITPDDFSKLLIVPGHDYVTLLTCTPVGINSHRLIVRGHRVPYVPAVEEQVIAENETNFRYRYLFYAAIALILFLLILIFLLRSRAKRLERRMKKLEQEKGLGVPDKPSEEAIDGAQDASSQAADGSSGEPDENSDVKGRKS